MNLTKRQFTQALAASLLPLGQARAQAFPNHPLQLVIPFPPGGATDVAGRLIGKKLGERLGQSVVIDNRAGAGTVVGATVVANAPADGYTLLLSSGSTFTLNPALNPRLPYDPVKSFEPIGMTARVPMAVLVNKQVPIDTLKQLVSAVKQAPDRYAYASFGSGTSSHFAGELVWNALGIKLLHVPYKGSAPAMTDLIGGQVPISIDTVAAALPHVRSGKIKVIALTGPQRSPLLPEVPTVAESTGTDFAFDAWLALMAPRGLPADARQRLQVALAETMSDNDLRDKLLAAGMQKDWASAQAVSKLIDAELPRMRAIALRAGIQAE
ncbi:MAG: tripartite tricarboxylate transporter substrate binding protein [Curvibacter lanceolatus]|jgi:tripartite-type tricarboxylate transporter receptor subunit TctC|uniref:Bug family tripartite tricarboxylate transporter substrate binding protein n=1 Tax=Curvibacter lanceolatus TaxID=86182 RepID=UPI000378174F|nr:tripartite tricarboxylate transporter substrate binding protein [Curvibacter lanceolatus]MBV5294009.1 tripartite tricarboxylate transporter substrate binding protein [Curvibacter lanceolatus]